MKSILPENPALRTDWAKRSPNDPGLSEAPRTAIDRASNIGASRSVSAPAKAPLPETPIIKRP